MFGVNASKYSLIALATLLFSILSQVSFLDEQPYSATEPYSETTFEDVLSDSDGSPESDFDSVSTSYDNHLLLSQSLFSPEKFSAKLSINLKYDVSRFIDVRGPPSFLS